MTPTGTISVTVAPDFSGFIAALRAVQRAATSTRRYFSRIHMQVILAELEDAAMDEGLCPSFPYFGDLDELAELAPASAGRFALRAEIECMKKRLQETT